MKRHHEEEHENHERWLVSYADFITLLFAFFVVLYSISRVDNKRMVQVVQAIKFAMHFKGTGGVGELPLFDGPPSEGGCVTNLGTERKNTNASADIQAVETLRRHLDKKLRHFVDVRKDVTTAVVVVAEGRRLTVRLSASHFFDPSKAAIRPEMIPVLDVIAGELGSLRRKVRIEGHTDPGAIGSGRFRDNWDLSASRAAAVASYVDRAGEIDPKLLAAVGYAATRPLNNNATPAGREANRRVEMVVELNPGDTAASFAP
ncbi:MAG: flagellar motor protein MotB [Pseudomonadota bacterium]